MFQLSQSNFTRATWVAARSGECKEKKINTTAWKTVLEISYYVGAQLKQLPEDLKAVSHSKARVNRVS